MKIGSLTFAFSNSGIKMKSKKRKILFIIRNTGDKKYKVISITIMISMFWPIMSTGSLFKNWFGITTFFIIGLCMCLSYLKDNKYNNPNIVDPSLIPIIENLNPSII